MPGGKTHGPAGWIGRKQTLHEEDCIRLMNARRETMIADRDASAPGGPSTARAGQPQWKWQWLRVAVLLYCAALAAPTPAAPSVQEQAAMDQANLRRGQIGLPALSYNQYLEQASRAHAGYLATNNTTGHVESSGLPGFTGVNLSNRIAATLYGTPQSSNEVISFGAQTGVDVSHVRLPFLSLTHL